MKKYKAGYPAYAGTDPNGREYQRRHDRLPRIRGDRPLVGFLPNCVIVATPHTRGSTREMIDLAWEIIGYPAYAGIDPQSMVSRYKFLGLPRIRGDRP